MRFSIVIPAVTLFLAAAYTNAFSDTYIVTSLADSGAGTLRYGIDNAPLEGRTILFAGVGPGTITNLTALTIDSSNIIVDGLTASGAITISGKRLEIKGDGTNPVDYTQTQNVVVRGLRFASPDTGEDEIWIRDNANLVTVEYCSFGAQQDGMVDVTQGAYNVTIRYNLFLNGMDGAGAGSSLVSYGSHSVSYHHNLFYRSKYRTPNLSARACEAYTYCSDNSQEFRGDVRYNIVWIGQTAGTWVEDSKVNFAYNLFKQIDYDHRHVAFFNNDANASGGSTYVSEVYMNGNATIDDCTRSNVYNSGSIPNPYSVTGSNWHNNHAEFAFSLKASGAVLPNYSGIVAEWQDALSNAGLVSAFTDTVDEAAARAAVTLPSASTYTDNAWNIPDEESSSPPATGCLVLKLESGRMKTCR